MRALGIGLLVLLLGVGGCKQSPTAPEMQNRPPVIKTYSPPGTQVQLQPGQTQIFSVQATDADDDPLSDRWLLQSKEVGRGPSYTFTAGQSGDFSLQAEVSDGKGGVAQRSWNVVMAQNVPPAVTLRIVGTNVVGSNQETTVAATAFDPYHYPDSLVTLRLSINDSLVAETSSADTARIGYVFHGNEWPPAIYTVKAGATDGEMTTEKAITLTRAASQPPQIIITPTKETYVKQGFNLHLPVASAERTERAS